VAATKTQESHFLSLTNDKQKLQPRVNASKIEKDELDKTRTVLEGGVKTTGAVKQRDLDAFERQLKKIAERQQKTLRLLPVPETQSSMKDFKLQLSPIEKDKSFTYDIKTVLSTV